MEWPGAGRQYIDLLHECCIMCVGRPRWGSSVVRNSRAGGYVIGVATITFAMVTVAAVVVGIVWVVLKIF